MDSLLGKLNKLTNWQVAIIITVVGFAVFSAGLTNPFQGDDNTQIVNNPVVHSISHVKILFEGGASYNGGGIAPLSGIYYRPLMSATFALLYTLFGEHTFFFHLLQLFLFIGSAILLFMVFRYSSGLILSLVLSIIFLVHPLNSQVIYAIPSMQDALFFFFGILAFWLLLRFKSLRSLGLVVFCLVLSLLSKEAGMLFMIMILLYLGIFDRRRLLPLIGIMAIPLIAYWILKVHAVGLSMGSTVAPIDRISLGHRLFTAPSIILFFISKFLIPWKLATAYYWAYSSFSFKHVFLPLLVDFAVIGLLIYMAFVTRRLASKTQFHTFIFFTIWTVLGLLPYLQVIPLDMTVCETWFYFPMVGVLGIIGVVLLTFQAHIRPSWFVVIAALVIALFGARTFIRSLDYRSAYILSSGNIAASGEDYSAYNDLAFYFLKKGDYVQARANAQRSVNIFPTFANNSNLGVAKEDLGDYPGAYQAYRAGLRYGDYNLLWENLAALTLVYGKYNENKRTLEQGLEKLPQDSLIWMYAAFLEYRHGNNTRAKVDINNAVTYGQVPSQVYNSIMNEQPFTVNIPNLGTSVHLP